MNYFKMNQQLKNNFFCIRWFVAIYFVSVESVTLENDFSCIEGPF